MTNLYTTAILDSVVEALTVDALVLLDEVDSYFADDNEASAIAVEAHGTIASGSGLSLWVSRLVEDLLRCIARAGLDPEATELAVEFRADWGDTARPPSARALGEAAFNLFDRWDRLQIVRATATCPSGPARRLQEDLAARLAA